MVLHGLESLLHMKRCHAQQLAKIYTWAIGHCQRQQQQLQGLLTQ